MWMKREFGRWEVEGRVEERINEALRDAEHARLLRAVRGPKTRATFGDVLNKVKATLRAVDPRAGRLQLQEPTA
jgi:hypothetical protein